MPSDALQWLLIETTSDNTDHNLNTFSYLAGRAFGISISAEEIEIDSEKWRAIIEQAEKVVPIREQLREMLKNERLHHDSPKAFMETIRYYLSKPNCKSLIESGLITNLQDLEKALGKPEGESLKHNKRI